MLLRIRRGNGIVDFVFGPSLGMIFIRFYIRRVCQAALSVTSYDWQVAKKAKVVKKTAQSVCLYSNAVLIGYNIYKTIPYPSCTLLEIDGVQSRDHT